MEVHTHSHTERKKWFHYFWEFLMLFLAVTLGFLVENQREHYVEHQRLVRFAKQLVNGLARDTIQQNGVIDVLDFKERSLDSLRYFLAMPKDDSLKWKGVYNNVLILENPFRYTYQKPVFDQINYSGSLRLFNNERIADSLLGYIYNGTIIEWQTNAEIDYITGVVIPFMNTHFDKKLNLHEDRIAIFGQIFSPAAVPKDALFDFQLKNHRTQQGTTLKTPRNNVSIFSFQYEYGRVLP
jgi:hypothetical protein